MVSIRFSRGSGLAGAIVRYATWSDFAHVGFKLDEGSVLDATPEAGVTMRIAADDATTQYWRIAAEDPVVIDQAVLWAKGQIGKPYDWTAIYGMALRRDWHKDTAWFCSELVTAAFDAAGWPLITDSGKCNRITPRDLTLATRIVQIVPPPEPA
jgi:uncharacterized protein YycO